MVLFRLLAEQTPNPSYSTWLADLQIRSIKNGHGQACIFKLWMDYQARRKLGNCQQFYWRKSGACWGEEITIIKRDTEYSLDHYLSWQTLKSQTRIQPFPPRGLWPFLTATDLNVDAAKHVRVVSFAHRPQIGSGQFYDYSARYGAVREQDRFTLRQYLLNACDGSSDQETRILRLAEAVELSNFLSLPLIALSNGQTRRARIVKALLHRPKVLVLDEPLSTCPPLHCSFLCLMHIVSQRA